MHISANFPAKIIIINQEIKTEMLHRLHLQPLHRIIITIHLANLDLIGAHRFKVFILFFNRNRK
jgi:hypothetical protein